MGQNYKYKIGNIGVVYEDDWFVIVDKPAGLLTIPTPKKESRTLTSILNDDLKEKGKSYRLHPCHRLDRETSGLIIYAKGKSAQKRMMEEFRQKKIEKTYIAFVHKALARNEGEIAVPIEEQRALTRYRVIRRKKDFTVVRVTPLTGRKNQIRLHFKALGHPLVGETRFAFRKDFPLKAKRLCLHAQAIEFRHPFTGGYLRVEAELAQDLENFLNSHPD